MMRRWRGRLQMLYQPIRRELHEERIEAAESTAHKEQANRNQKTAAQFLHDMGVAIKATQSSGGAREQQGRCQKETSRLMNHG